MELTTSQKKTIRHQFDSFCRKILREAARDYIRELSGLAEHQVSLSDLSGEEMAQFYTLDDYPSDSHRFNVQGLYVPIQNDQLAEALASLPTEQRDIVLLAYVLDMTDREVAEKLNMVRYTVQRRRAKSIKELKKDWKEDAPVVNTATRSISSLVSYMTIATATTGDVDAINAVLRHYERYIAALSMRTLYDENDNPHLCVDEEMKRRLETKLITGILKFDAQRIA